MEYLALNDNEFSNSMPNELSLLSNMRSLNLGENKFSGAFPNISNMVKLENLQIHSNKFTGTIPESIQQLQSIGTFIIDGGLPFFAVQSLTQFFSHC
jgi:Leucine-rich repeat (LRR) protein